MPDGNSADKKWMEEENVAGKDLLIHFFDAYLVKRDLERALACLSDNIVSLGTGAHEVALNKGELKKLMEAEFAEIPGGFRYEIKDYCEHWYREDLYGVYCAVAVVMPEEAGAEVTLSTRLTMTAAKLCEGWRIISLHMSAPSDQQEGEEFFPIKYGRQAVGKLDAESSRTLVNLMMSMLPGGIMGGYLEKGFPLYIINDTMLNYLGYTYDELIEATGEEMQKIIAPEDWERVEKAVYEGIKKRGEYDVQYRVVRKDGTRLWVNDRGREIITEDGRKAMLSIMLDISKDIRLRETLRREAMEDFLTGILNRKGAMERLKAFLEKGRGGALFALDIDDFKRINDTYGHQFGDQVLILLANTLKECSRQEDMAARIGGDEFLLFLPDCTQNEVLAKRKETIRNRFREAGRELNGIELSVSIGIAASHGEKELEQFIKEADDRLYEMKKSRMSRI